MAKKNWNSLLFHFLVILFGLFMIYPLLWMLTSSFKPGNEIFKGTSFLPTTWTLENYSVGWSGISGYSFGHFLLNSFYIVVLAIIGNVLSCSMAAYSFSKVEYRSRNLWFTLMLVSMMLPLHVRLIPQYILYNKLGWVNTYYPMIIPKFLATEGFFVFMMTQYMRALPRDIDEAATIDGCNHVMHYARIILPLSVPSIITTCIFTFIWTWNDFFTQMIYLSNIRTFTVSIALRQYTDAMGESYWGAMFSMSIVSLIPLFLMFILFQRYLIEGVTAGSIKG
ncbi:MAG: carbohydrate ABC transporter permease [Eubacteriales bacterium]|nr:carbohydrate ABC transporter permease [Eubacteriales bacterium]